MQQRLPRADAERALGYSSSTARHAVMPPTAARLSAQPAIVNIRRVDAFIAARRGALLLVLIVFTALLECADEYSDRAVLALRAHVHPLLTPARRAFAFATARPWTDTK